MRRSVVVALLLLSGCGPSPLPGSIGVRARREPESGRVVVIEVPEGSAGARAGLERGDEILAIDGVPVATMSVREFHAAARGPVGTRVIVDVRRDGLVRRLSVERAAMRAVAK